MALDPPRERLMAGAAAGRAMDVLDPRLAEPMRRVQAGDKRADERLEDVVQETLVTLHNA